MRAKESGQSPLLLLDVIDILNKEKVPYVVIGAMAVSCYGVMRSSLDADAIIRMMEDRGDKDKLRRAFNKAGLNVVIKKGNHEDPLVGVILIEDNFGNHVDLLLGIKGVDNNLFKRVVPIEFQGETINMVSVEDLIVMKIYAGSIKDLADVKGILAVSKDTIDKKKLLGLARNFGKDITNTLKEMTQNT